MSNKSAANKQYVDSRVSTHGSISTAQTDVRYLSKLGVALSGELSMGDQKITDVGQPGNANDAVTKSYVDS